MGDVAMMQIAVARLSELWPRAEIGVLAARPDLLSRFCPDAVLIDVEARRAWLLGRSLIARVRRRLPPRASAFVQGLEEELWLRCPRLADLWVNFRAWALGKAIPPSPSGFRKRLTGADLLVVNGMGAFTDAFRENACAILDELRAVLRAGVPIVAFGQGIGPITDPELLARARAVLPRLKLIGLREGRMGLPFLESLGVPRERIHVTGDDAIELAYRLRPGSLGDAIGINLRLSDYAETDDDTVGKLREPLRRSAQALNCSLVPVPISFHLVRDSDVEAIGKLLEGQSQNSQAAIETPEDVIRQIGKCRVVVTGSYHAGVFALAQGIPVVGLVQSAYYEQKFDGLQEQFPGGCRTIDFRRPVTSGEIEDVIRNAWESAEEVRDSLLEAAARQIELGRSAYRTVRELYPLES
jgi:colanic acid/amylovoran biosynthesis protein